jgi:hypothetical protein
MCDAIRLTSRSASLFPAWVPLAFVLNILFARVTFSDGGVNTAYLSELLLPKISCPPEACLLGDNAREHGKRHGTGIRSVGTNGKGMTESGDWVVVTGEEHTKHRAMRFFGSDGDSVCDNDGSSGSCGGSGRYMHRPRMLEGALGRSIFRFDRDDDVYYSYNSSVFFFSFIAGPMLILVLAVVLIE